MKHIIAFWLFAWLALFGASVQATEQSTHVVVAGETLSKISGVNWKADCELNKLANCNKIHVGQTLKLTAVASVGKTHAAVVHHPSCITLGAAPWNPEHRLERTLEGIDQLTTLTSAQKAVAKRLVQEGVKTSENQLVRDELFKEMLYLSKVSGQAKHVYDKPVCTSEEGGKPEVMDTYALGDGTYLAIPRRCGNPAVYMKPEPVVVPPVAPVVEVPSSVPTPVVNMPESGCPIDPKLVVGAEYEPKHSGNDAKSVYAAWAGYCTYRVAHGTVGVGVGGQFSAWEGHVNGGAGKFSGDISLVGPAVEYISDAGWDVESKLLAGELNETFRQGNYRSERHFDVAGMSVAYNNYERRNRGEKWLPETQASIVWAVPTQQAHDFNTYVNAAVRQWVYDGALQPYVQAGYFLEDPTAESMSLRVGIADSNRICGIGAGVDIDLKQGGEAFAVGGWCDVVKGMQVYRKQQRIKQVIVEDDDANIDVY